MRSTVANVLGAEYDYISGLTVMTLFLEALPLPETCGGLSFNEGPYIPN
jgi:hypothetical protein